VPTNAVLPGIETQHQAQFYGLGLEGPGFNLKIFGSTTSLLKINNFWKYFNANNRKITLLQQQTMLLWSRWNSTLNLWVWYCLVTESKKNWKIQVQQYDIHKDFFCKTVAVWQRPMLFRYATNSVVETAIFHITLVTYSLVHKIFVSAHFLCRRNCEIILQ